MSLPRLLFALFLVTLGVLLLVANLGWLDWTFFVAIWRLWPLILIVLGVYFLFGRRRGGLAAGIILGVLVVGVGTAVVAWEAGWIDEAEVQEADITGPPARGIEQGSLVLDLGALDLNIEGAAPGNRVVEGSYDLRGDVSVEDERSGSTYRLALSQDGGGVIFPFFGASAQSVDLALAPDVVWTLDVNLGAASGTIDLRDTLLGSLALDAGASSVDLTIGRDVAPGAEVTVEGGAASYDIILPDNLTITLVTDTGLSSTDVDGRFERDGDTYVYDGGGEDLEVLISTGVSSIDVGLY